MKLEPHLELIFKRGLAEAARSTDAWVITGGTDTGTIRNLAYTHTHTHTHTHIYIYIYTYIYIYI